MIRRLLRWLDLDRWNDGYEQGYEDGWHDATVKAAVRVERDPVTYWGCTTLDCYYARLRTTYPRDWRRCDGCNGSLAEITLNPPEIDPAITDGLESRL